MVDNFLGRFMLSSFSQPIKVLLPIALKESGSFTVLRDLQQLKALLPIALSFSEFIVTLFIFTQFLKADEPIFSTFPSSKSPVKLLQPEKTDMPKV